MTKTADYDSSRWTGNSEPADALLVGLVLAAGAIGFLIIGMLEL